MCLLTAFLRNGICPTVIRNGRKILVMEIKINNLRFITSNSYFNEDEYDLASQYEIGYDKIYFPKQFMKIQNFDYRGQIPHFKYFASLLDNAKEKHEKQNFYEALSNQNYVWDFKKELIAFCEQKLWLLTASCIQFIKDCLSLQKNFENVFNLKLAERLIPFSYPLCSLSSYTYKLYKALFLNSYEIYVVNNEFGIKPKNVSQVENEWATFLDINHPEKNFESAFNNINGQRFFKEAIPDLYSSVTKEAFFFNGCVFHGHFENCLINPEATENSKTPFGRTYKEVNDEFLQKMTDLLMNNTNQIDEIIICWECNYKARREKCPQIQNFLKNKYFPHPLFRLQPRTCVRGAYFDVFALLWSQSKSPLENLYFLDINGLYSFCAINFPLMVGKYTTLIGKSLEKISLKDNVFFYNSKRILGSMLLTILPPKNLYFPFLLYRTKSGKTINTLCSSCCEKKNENCLHSDQQRAITSSYMISEIEYALSLNYKVLAIHECHIYERSDFILKDFVHHLNILKLKHSTCLENMKTLNEKLNYCKQLNTDMTLIDPFHLTPHNVKPNFRKRTFYKLMANALFGKLEQRNDKSHTIYVNQQSELEDVFFSENNIIDLNCINSEICEVQISPTSYKIPPNKNSNCYIGAQLTAYARQTIYKYLQVLERSNATIFQVDCDSLIFSLPKTEPIPLPISDAVGHFKHEIKNIKSYQSLGPKNYCITFEKDNCIQTITKVRGLSLNNSLNENIFTDELFKTYVQQFISKKKEKIQVKQFRTRGDFKRFKINSTIEQVSFSNALSDRRFICNESPHLNSFPYGYKK